MRSICKCFGWDNAFGKQKEKGWAASMTGRADRLDADLLDAAVGFWSGSQKVGMKGKNGRAGSTFRSNLLYDMCKFGNKGKLWRAIVREVQRDLRIDPVLIARTQDLHSTFNGQGLQSMRECLPGYTKGARGLIIPCQSSVNIPKEIVYQASSRTFGSIFPEGEQGQMWHWDFGKGVHAYLKAKYVDLCMESVTNQDPWVVVVTGDAARMSQRGHQVTTCGIKICDRRHPEQNGTGKLMNQSPSQYTPTICATGGEKGVMPAFRSMVRELAVIERKGHITVEGRDYNLPIKVAVVGDKSFMWKFTTRILSLHSFDSHTVRRPLMGCDDNLFMRNLSCRSLGQGRDTEQTLLEIGGGGPLGGGGPE